jgi:ribosome maturation factor RimP
MAEAAEPAANGVCAGRNPRHVRACAASASLVYAALHFIDESTGVAQKAAFFALNDENTPQLTGFDARLAEIIMPRIAAMGYELVRVRVLGRERPTVQIMADRADGAQISIDDCEAISHQIGAVLDVEDIIPGAWTLEVSSAGIDRPLTRPKDWNRFSGHAAKVEMAVPTLDGRKRFSGIVLGAEQGLGRLRMEDGSEVALNLSDVKSARLILTDALIEATAAPPSTQ